MADEYDIVLIGSGHNGLVAASYLAKAGQKVLVLEQNEVFGGGVVTTERVAAGFHHDTHSATHILIQANPLIRNDELGLLSKYGLKYHYPEAVFSTIFDDQSSIVTYVDLDRTCQSIAAISPRDADAYRRFAEKGMEILPMIVEGAFVPPLPQGSLWSLLDQSPMGQDYMSVLQKSTLDICREWFESDKVMIHLLKMAVEQLVAPEEKGTGIVLYTLPGFVHSYPSGVPEGGSGALVGALVNCLRDHGAELRTDAVVDKVVVEGGRAAAVRLKGGETIGAKRAVIAMVHPWLLSDLVDGLDERVATNARNTQPSAFSIMAGHYALNEPPIYHAGAAPGCAALVNYAPARMEPFLRIFDGFRYGDLISDDAIIASHEHAQFDPGLAPEGKAVFSVFGFAPFHLREGGSAAWDSRKDEIGNWLLERCRHYIPNLDDQNIIASRFDTPLDMPRSSPTFQAGDVNGVAKYLPQFGGHRPTPELAQYAVPGVEGLYLAGTFMHPGGGVTGGGRGTAIKMFDDLGIDFEQVTR
ncbi:MAG: NAD(P)/FAD-dependent oxidoreductase [Rhodospirillales bacterium]|nr:NAD(P)/FAD-dependent oxidoreductase [Rhodospirillales bacterium]